MTLDVEAQLSIDIGKRALRNFKGRTAALGRSANTPMESDLAEGLEAVLKVLEGKS
ncbi:hypothetical protein HOT31_gp135 [Microbacterium phage Hendrix]|uniref:Uncharacterized protein n=1 Tax=Microbacterium phage Hendrix TaxID=2182341 RepID=A0A2U8UUB8_9CAUD|nr:hypothetical protein HOT31_gp135 [Microbacterium phage Hendrix]AWN07805.1 hypothetical protein PBI_HENDRIX_134 [Microbacterium phage Hendrix]